MTIKCFESVHRVPMQCALVRDVVFVNNSQCGYAYGSLRVGFDFVKSVSTNKIYEILNTRFERATLELRMALFENDVYIQTINRIILAFDSTSVRNNEKTIFVTFKRETEIKRFIGLKIRLFM